MIGINLLPYPLKNYFTNLLEIPGFRYDNSIKNYVPILNDTPENRAFGLMKDSNKIKNENINILKCQIKSSKRYINKFRKHFYPVVNASVNLYNINRYQQSGIHSFKNNIIFNLKTLNFNSEVSNLNEFDELNAYHNIYKCFPPDFDSQIMMASYSSSATRVHHSLFKINYSDYQSKNSLESQSHLIKKFDSLRGIKLSVDGKRFVMVNNQEFCLINKDTQNEANFKYPSKLPANARRAFDISDKLLASMPSKNGMTCLMSYDLLSIDAHLQYYKCDWDRKWLINDIVYDINGANVFLSLRGRMDNSTECIYQYDFRSPVPSYKNIRRLSLNFHQNSSVNLKRVPNYSDLIVTHCYDGRCALWDMRWKSRPAVIYQNVAPGKPGVPIDIDPSSRFVTLTDNENNIRIFNLKTGLALYCEKHPTNYSGDHIFSFYSETGLHCRPTLLSNFSPAETHIQYLDL